MSGKKKILLFGYLPPPYFGPSTTYQALLSSEFARHFDVTFINISMVKDLSELESFHPRKVLRTLRILLAECGHLLTRRFDICSCPISVNRNAFLRDALFLALARLRGIPTVVYAHGNNLPDLHARSGWLMKRVMNTTLRKAAGGIVMGKRLLPNLNQWLPNDRIFPATDGIIPCANLPDVRKDDRFITVAYLSNLIPEKGVFVTLEAAAQVAKARRDIRFVFAGAWWKAADEQRANEFIQRERLADRVTFAGSVAGDAKWRLLAGADMLVFPTFYYYETLGLVLLEAMQCALPVVTTRRACIPEIVEDGVNGLLVEEQSPSDLAEKILRLASDPALRAQMGEANRRKFAACYTHEAYGRRMIEAFEVMAR